MNFSNCLCFAVFLLLGVLSTPSKGDDSPGFFLKITKNVPRLGRRSDKEYDSYFMKNMKTIPRIGRSGDKFKELIAWFDATPRRVPGKRALMSPAAAAIAAEREYSVVQPVNANTLIELLDKDAIPADNVKFVHWKDFDRALQTDMDLYGKVISLGRKPDQRLKADLGVVNSGSYIPLMSNSNDGGADFMLYNKDFDGDNYPQTYHRDFLQYNHL